MRAGETLANPLRGEFFAVLAGERIRFDTRLATVALVEEGCGGVPIVEAINKVVFGRRAADALALITGALAAVGYADAEVLAARTSSVEAEAFVLGLMAALGFEVVRRPRDGEGDLNPFVAGAAPETPATAESRIGANGGASRSAP